MHTLFMFIQKKNWILPYISYHSRTVWVHSTISEDVFDSWHCHLCRWLLIGYLPLYTRLEKKRIRSVRTGSFLNTRGEVLVSERSNKMVRSRPRRLSEPGLGLRESRSSTEMRRPFLIHVLTWSTDSRSPLPSAKAAELDEWESEPSVVTPPEDERYTCRMY